MLVYWKNMTPQTTKLIEECSEVIHALCKVERFGEFNTHPDRPDVSNLEHVLEEIEDLREALQDYVESIT